MTATSSAVTRCLGASAILIAGLATGPESRAAENTLQATVLQSGHVGGDAWRRSPNGRGLALSFEDQAAVRSAARQELRRLLRNEADELGLSPSVWLPDVATSMRRVPGGALLDGLSDGLGDGMRVSRNIGGFDLDLRPRLGLDANLDDAEARVGLRLQWGRGLTRPVDDRRLRSFVYADWEGRAGLDNMFGGADKTGGHDLDAGLGLTAGDWTLSVEGNLAGSGFGDREGHGASGFLGYAVRF